MTIEIEYMTPEYADITTYSDSEKKLKQIHTRITFTVHSGGMKLEGTLTKPGEVDWAEARFAVKQHVMNLQND